MNLVSRFETTTEFRKRCKISSQRDQQQIRNWWRMELTNLCLRRTCSRLELKVDKLGQYPYRQDTVLRRLPRKEMNQEEIASKRDESRVALTKKEFSNYKFYSTFVSNKTLEV